MRLNYYRFPEDVDAQIRWQNGAEDITATCEPNPDFQGGICLHYNGEFSLRPMCRDCGHYQVIEAYDTVEGITVTAAKKLLRQFGGSAWTAHIERDGGVFEVTDITLTGNNSRFKYNRHL